MTVLRTLLVSAFLIAFSGISWAIECEPDEGTEAHVPTVVHDMLLLGPEETIDPRTVRADLDFAAQMQRHHEGAVTMSREYLEDPRGNEPDPAQDGARDHRESALRDRHAGRRKASCGDRAGDGAGPRARASGASVGGDRRARARVGESSEREPPGFVDLEHFPITHGHSRQQQSS